MVERPNALQTLGIEITPYSIRAVRLALQKKGVAVEKLYEIPCEFNASPTPEFVFHLFSSGEGADLKKNLEKDLTVTCLSAADVLVRPLEVKLKKENAIDEVLPFQAEPLLPYPVENAVLERIFLNQDGEGTLLTLLAVRKDHLQQHLLHLNALEIEPEIVSCAPVALAAFAEQFGDKSPYTLALHLGFQNGLCVLLKEGKLAASQGCRSGLESLLKAYAEDQKQPLSLAEASFLSLDFPSITPNSSPLLYEALETFKSELLRTVFSLSKLVRGQEAQSLLLTGEMGPYPQLVNYLCQGLNKKIIFPEPHGEIDLPSQQLQMWALPLGAALTPLPSDAPRSPQLVNFRQEDFTYPHPWKRYKVPLALYLGLCAGLALSLFFMGFSYLKYREDKVREQYAELLAANHRPYTPFEKDFKAKSKGLKSGADETPTPLSELSQGEIAERLNHLEKEIQAIPDIYPLFPNIPTVSDVLAWLSTHPKVVAKDAQGEKLPLIQLENFSYSLVKRPDITKKQERYQAKVEIEFSTNTPKAAREFHDALIAPNAMIDPKGEVKWNTNRGLYKATFYLKDRTMYPL